VYGEIFVSSKKLISLRKKMRTKISKCSRAPVDENLRSDWVVGEIQAVNVTVVGSSAQLQKPAAHGKRLPQKHSAPCVGLQVALWNNFF
jgi:hypothetical protein